MKCIILAAAAMFTFSFSAMAVAQGNDVSSVASAAGVAVTENAGRDNVVLDMSGVEEKAAPASDDVVRDVLWFDNPVADGTDPLAP